MMAALRDRIDRFFGRGSASTSVPIMDGPFQPNNRIEEAPVVVSADDLDNLIDLGGVRGAGFLPARGSNLRRP